MAKYKAKRNFHKNMDQVMAGSVVELSDDFLKENPHIKPLVEPVSGSSSKEKEEDKEPKGKEKNEDKKFEKRKPTFKKGGRPRKTKHKL